VSVRLIGASSDRRGLEQGVTPAVRREVEDGVALDGAVVTEELP